MISESQTYQQGDLLLLIILRGAIFRAMLPDFDFLFQYEGKKSSFSQQVIRPFKFY